MLIEFEKIEELIKTGLYDECKKKEKIFGEKYE